jgi:hypothetical protein
MGGHRQRRSRPDREIVGIQTGQDETGIYEAACIEFADDRGYTHAFVCYWWSPIALERGTTSAPRSMSEGSPVTDPYAPFAAHLRGCGVCASGRQCADGETIAARCARLAQRLVAPLPPIPRSEVKA